jgi:hypothetical protein
MDEHLLAQGAFFNFAEDAHPVQHTVPLFIDNLIKNLLSHLCNQAFASAVSVQLAL